MTPLPTTVIARPRAVLQWAEAISRRFERLPNERPAQVRRLTQPLVTRCNRFREKALPNRLDERPTSRPQPLSFYPTSYISASPHTKCWTERGTERLRIRGSEPQGPSKPLVATRDETAQRESRSRRGPSTWSRFSGSLLDHLPGMVGEASTISSQSASLSLGRFGKTADRLSPVGTPRP